MKLEDTIRSFEVIINGEVDHIPEVHFMYKGTIDDVQASFDASQSE